MVEDKDLIIKESLLSDLIVQVAILKEIYDKIEKEKRMPFAQRKILLMNKTKNKELMTTLEELYSD